MNALGLSRAARHTRVVIALVAAWLYLRTAPACAEGDSALTETPATQQAQAAFERGVDLAELKRFAEARNEFKASFQMAPSRSALFAWAQAERLAGNCVQAEPLYQRFLQNAAALEQQEAARIALRRCQDAAKTSSPPPAVAAPIAMPSPAPPPRETKQLWPFVATGAALVVAGAVALLAAQLDANAASDAQAYQQYRDARERVQIERIVGLSAVSAGLVTLGVTAWLGQRPQETLPNVALWLPNVSAVGATWTGAF